MASKQDNTLTDDREETVQTGIRIPLELQKTVAKAAIDRETTAQQLWIDAMRKFLKLPSPNKDAA